jgi:DNA-binding CsgD family transcriptional regulator
MAISFEEYVEKINKCRTVEELLQVFLETVKQHGYDKMIFCLLSDHKQIGLAAGVGHLRNYPADWMKYYFEQCFHQCDPVISYTYQKMGTFTWQEMSERLVLTRKQKLCLNLGTEAGLHNGICTPLWGGPHRFAGIGLATTEKKDACEVKLDIMTAYCNQFYIAFQRLHAPPQDTSRPVPNIYLTRREKEILTMVSEGKSDEAIAVLLKLTPHGVDFHMRNIYTKMQTNSRTYAVSKAIELGLIHPLLHPYVSV